VPFLALLVFYCLTNLAANTNGQFGTYIAVNVVGISVQLTSQLLLLAFPLGIISGLLFMKFVGTRFRMPLFAIGAVLLVASYAVPVVFGFTLVTFAVMKFFGAVGGAFAFEGMMKVWTQESFPTMLRSTAQGGIIAVARVLAAVLAVLTPALVEFSPRLTYAGLVALVAIGLGIAWLTFRKRVRNEFDVEGTTDGDRNGNRDFADQPANGRYM
jgi:inositol transporter-like SP family MFS transporter